MLLDLIENLAECACGRVLPLCKREENKSVSMGTRLLNMNLGTYHQILILRTTRKLCFI
jgi:hypothetical protein